VVEVLFTLKPKLVLFLIVVSYACAGGDIFARILRRRERCKLPLS
jgi:hypothetical protein